MLITVNASAVKLAFKALKPLYLGYSEGMLLGIFVEQHTLYIIGTNGSVYEQRISCEFEGPYAITVLYQDLSELLPGTETLSIELAPMFVRISSQQFSTTLPQANGIIPRYVHQCISFETISASVLRSWSMLFSLTSPVAKSLAKEAPIIFKAPFAIMKYPTFWLQLKNPFLDTTMTLQELKTVAEFSPEEYGIVDHVIEFRRGPATLALPRTPVDTCNDIDSVTRNHDHYRKVKPFNYLPRIQQYLRSVGSGPCTCSFYADGIQLSVARTGIQSSFKIGACSELVKTIPSFLEYIQMFFRLCGEEAISLSWNAQSIRISTDSLSMLSTIQ